MSTTIHFNRQASAEPETTLSKGRGAACGVSGPVGRACYLTVTSSPLLVTCKRCQKRISDEIAASTDAVLRTIEADADAAEAERRATGNLSTDDRIDDYNRAAAEREQEQADTESIAAAVESIDFAGLAQRVLAHREQAEADYQARQPEAVREAARAEMAAERAEQLAGRYEDAIVSLRIRVQSAQHDLDRAIVDLNAIGMTFGAFSGYGPIGHQTPFDLAVAARRIGELYTELQPLPGGKELIERAITRAAERIV